MGRFPLLEKEIVAEEKDKPVVDEQTLAKLLEAAYVLQEHNRKRQEMELAFELKSELLPELKPEQLEAELRSTLAQSAPQIQEPEPAAPIADYTSTLAKIVETQHLMQLRHLELGSALSLVAEQLIQIARASGAAIGILESNEDGENLRYRATAGALTPATGTDVPAEKALCASCLESGDVFRCADVNLELLVDAEQCRRRGIESLIAVPVFHNGKVAGGLELYYATTRAFTDQDVHSCQLMAGLITEALVRDEEVTWKKSRATERAAMLEALEKLTPNLATLVDKPAAEETKVRPSAPAEAATASDFFCRKCAHQLVGEEQFCGNCGTPRSSDYEPPSMQSKVASMWQMQEAMKKAPPLDSANRAPAPVESRVNLDRIPLDRIPSEKSLSDPLAGQTRALFAAVKLPVDDTAESTEFSDAPSPQLPTYQSPSHQSTSDQGTIHPSTIHAEFEDPVLSDIEVPLDAIPLETDYLETGEEDEVEAPQSTALAKTETTAAWSSAASARDFLEQLASTRRPGGVTRFWNSHRGDIYLAIAVLLIAGVIRWVTVSNHSVKATGSPAAAAAAHRKPAPEADLSLFDRMLISMGLAEAPPTPESKGNPETQVWVDLHTALYYCPGADLYGKTPKGKFTSQRDAQLDQFEPAYRKACD
jgi:GAF domain-containing protein